MSEEVLATIKYYYQYKIKKKNGGCSLSLIFPERKTCFHTAGLIHQNFAKVELCVNLTSVNVEANLLTICIHQMCKTARAVCLASLP